MQRGSIGATQLPSGDPAFGDYWLMLIAINDYLHWPPLRGPAKDCQAVEEVLLEHYTFDPSRTVKLFNRDATRAGILNAFRELKQAVQPDDNVLIYYAGHGYTDEFNVGYWIPYEAGIDPDSAEGWLPNANVRGALAGLECAHVFLIADSCFSGDLLEVERGLRPVLDQEYFQRAHERRSREVMTSGASEPVSDISLGGHSAFAFHLLDTLKRNREACIDPLRVYDRVRSGVTGQEPILGSLPRAGHQRGGSFLFFLRSIGDEHEVVGDQVETEEVQQAVDQEPQEILQENPGLTETMGSEAIESEEHSSNETRQGWLKTVWIGLGMVSMALVVWWFVVWQQETTRIQKDHLAYQQAEMVNTPQSYRVYLTTYLEGRHIEEARAKLTEFDDLAYKGASEQGKKDSYERYLHEWPEGQYRSDVQEHLKVIEQRMKEARLEEARQSEVNDNLKEGKSALNRRVYDEAVSAFEKVLKIEAGHIEAVRMLEEAKSLERQMHGMAYIPEGSFRMGSYTGNGHEKPVHEVYIDGFWIDKYEVTNAQYANFVRATGHRVPYSDGWGKANWNIWQGNSPPNGMSEHPVVGVSWEDARKYCEWARKRLPTEAEWEKVCRGGMKGKLYPWGDSISTSRANYYGNGKGKTVPIGSYHPNEYGVYDMSGNISEWCSDLYYYYIGSEFENPQYLLPTTRIRVLRGGSWGDGSYNIRCATRKRAGEEARFGNWGFRCARSKTD